MWPTLKLSAGQLKDLHGPFTRTLSLWPGTFGSSWAVVCNCGIKLHSHEAATQCFFRHEAGRTFKDEQEQE